MCAVATFFLEYWKRTTAKLAHRWDVMGIEEEAVSECLIDRVSGRHACT